MTALFSAAGRAFLRAFIGSLIVLAPGILDAPNLNKMYLVGVAGLIAGIVALLRVVQAYVPEIALSKYLGHPFGDWADAFLQGAIGSLLVTLPGISNAPDLNTTRSLVTAALVGAFTAGVRAVQGLLTTGEFPSPHLGLNPPEMPYTYTAPPK